MSILDQQILDQICNEYWITVTNNVQPIPLFKDFKVVFLLMRKNKRHNAACHLNYNFAIFEVVVEKDEM